MSMIDWKGNEMGYVLRVYAIATDKLVYDNVYSNYSGHAMMDEIKHLYRTRFARDLYRIEWTSH